MSKGNMLLGYAKGKVGSLVFARRLGQQVTRPYNGSPANPRTLSQMSRRIKWANIINMWRLLKPYIVMGMQSRKTTQSDYNKFVSLNLNQSEAYLLKEEARQGATLLAPYIVTSGSLGLRSMRSAAITGIAVGETDLVSATIGQLSAAIIANNQGIQVGDQLTVFALGQTLIESIPQVLPYAFKFIVTDAANEVPALDAIEIFGSVAPAIEDGYLAFEFSGVEYGTYAGAIVQSRILADGSLAVSDSRLTIETDVDDTQQSTSPFGVSKSEALASYGFNPGAFLSPASAGQVAFAKLSSIEGVSANGTAVSDGGTYTLDGGGEQTFVVTGRHFDEAPLSVTVGGSPVAVSAASATSASFTVTVPGNYAGVAVVVTSSTNSWSFTARGTDIPL